MPRTELPFMARDISALAKSIRRDLADGSPSHVEMLNMLARGAGYRNFQHFRAQRMAEARLDEPVPPAAQVDHRRVERVARLFDQAGRMTRWPTRLNHQLLSLWAFWSRMPRGEAMTEAAVNERLNAAHLFGDPAILRRMLVGNRMMTRNRDGSDYRRVETAPPPEAAALIRHVNRKT